MTDLETRFHRSLDGLTAPDLRARIDQRSVDSGQLRYDGQSRPESWRRVAVAVTAFAIFAAAGVFAWRAFEGDEVAASAGASPTPPGWLVDEARNMVKNNGGVTPTSARWVLTDAKAAAPSVGLNPDEVDADPRYLVVLEGDFVALMASRPPGADAPKGTTLVFAADPATHQVTDWGVTNEPIDVPGLADFDLLGPSPAPTHESSRAIPADGIVIAVLNGTNYVGLAGSITERLVADGYSLGQAPTDAVMKPVSSTVVYFAGDSDASQNATAAKAIADKYFDGTTEALPPALAKVVDKDVQVVILAGSDAA